MIDQNLDFDGFINVLSAYNELINFIVSIVKYNSLSQSLRVPIDERMDKINGYLTNLIDRCQVDKEYILKDLEQIQDNIQNRIYKLVNIDVNFAQFNVNENQKKMIIEAIDRTIAEMRSIKGNRKAHAPDIK